MRVPLSTCGSRGDAEPLVGLALQLVALGAEVRMRTADLLARATELVAQLDTVAALAEGCDAPVADGAMPTGARR